MDENVGIIFKIMLSGLSIYIFYRLMKSSLSKRERNVKVDSYSGDKIDGKPDGLGTWIYTKDEKFIGKYEGNWKNGLRHGKGTMYDKFGGKTNGEWNNGKYIDNNPPK